jgi:hypothetical protein
MSELNRTDLENILFQKVIDGEFVPNSENICGNNFCSNCDFNPECQELFIDKANRLADPKNYQRFKENYPEYFL